MAVDKTRKLQEEHGHDAFTVGMGAEAIRELLRAMDMDVLARELRTGWASRRPRRSGRRSSSVSRSSRPSSSPATSPSG